MSANIRTKSTTTTRARVILATVAALTINAVLAAGLLGMGSHSSASSGGPSALVVKAQDDCEPASFNAALGAGTCVGDGDTTLDELVGQLLADRDAHKWRFSRTHHKVKNGGHIVVPNEGGEFHTFSEVAEFGGGCIPALNSLMGGLTPVAECEPEAAPGVPLAFVTTGVPAGQSITVTGLTRGVHRFECLIHPWMRSTITVR